MDFASSLFTLVSTLAGSALTFLIQKTLNAQNNNLVLETKLLEKNYEKNNQRFQKIESKLEEAHILASELGREFSLTFLNIDWEINMSVSDYDSKYRDLCVKCSKIQMIADLYAPILSDSVNELSAGMNMYWGNFRIVLAKTNDGVKTSELGKVFDDAVKYSEIVPDKARALKYKLSDYYAELQTTA